MVGRVFSLFSSIEVAFKIEIRVLHWPNQLYIASLIAYIFSFRLGL